MKNYKGVFITGTDTGVGKTVVTGLLARFLMAKGVKTITQKWVETGSRASFGDIAGHGLKKFLPDMVPFSFSFPSSPHLAALLEGEKIGEKKIKESFRRLTKDFDFVIVEGTGGALVPISEQRLMIDVVKSLAIPVLVVSENRLGAINQTLLAIEVLKKRNIKIVGIIFNRLSTKGDRTILKDNIKIIRKFTGENVLGELPYDENKHALYANFSSIGKQFLKILNF